MRKMLFLLFFFIFPYSIVFAETLDENIIEQIKNGEVRLTYELFGAKGDGVTNDYDSIKQAHDLANQIYVEDDINITVYATLGKTYYLSTGDTAIDVITNVDWQNANFIIDDYVDANHDNVNDIITTNSIFSVTNPIFVQTKLTAGNGIQYLQLVDNLDSNLTISSDTKNLSIIIDYLKKNEIYQNNEYIQKQFLCSKYWGVSITDDNMQFIRKGLNASSGYKQIEVLVIDSTNGNIVTDINWDYDNITSLCVYPMYLDTIAIKNGNFLTKTNNVVYETEIKNAYSNRNIFINYTGNITLSNITHSVDESSHPFTSSYQSKSNGNLYYGFIRLQQTSFVHLNNLKLSARTYTNFVQDGIEVSAGNGTYDLILDNSTNIFLDHVSYYCSNDNEDTCYYTNMKDQTKWGTMGSNYTKNVFIVNSDLNRIDSHRGVTNLYVTDSVVGVYGFTLIGNGYFYANNVTVDGAVALVNLRNDYGSTFDGSLVMENMVYQVGDSAEILYSNNTEDHDFGYTTYFPSVYMRNLRIDTSKSTSFDTLYFIVLANNIKNTAVVNNDKMLYYFKPEIYLQDVKLSDGIFKLFPDSFVNSTENLRLGSYGGSNSVSLFLDNIVSVPEAVKNLSDSKFQLVSQMTFSFDTVKNYFQNIYDQYYTIYNHILIQDDSEEITVNPKTGGLLVMIPLICLVVFPVLIWYFFRQNKIKNT